MVTVQLYSTNFSAPSHFEKMDKKYVNPKAVKETKVTLTAKFANGKYKLLNFVAENCINDHNKVNSDTKINKN